MRNIGLSLATLLFLLGPIGTLFAHDVLCLDISSWVESEEVSYLNGARPISLVLDDMWGEKALSGELQSSIEAKVDSGIPLKAKVLLSNATLQRTAIAASNSLFGWNCYLTFFGSSILYDPGMNTLAYSPLKDMGQVEGVLQFAAGVKNFVGNHPDKQVCIVVPDISYSSESNPAFDLVSSEFTTRQCFDALRDELEDYTNVRVESSLYSSLSEYLYDFYLSDHHWNGYGTLKTYNDLANQMGWALQEDPEPVFGLEDVQFNGTCSRSGLMLLNERPQEPKFDLEHLVPDSADLLLLFDQSEDIDNYKMQTTFNFYNAWYGSQHTMTISNAAAEGKGSVLLICDSYGQTFRWPLARNFSTTYVDTNRVRPDGETLISRMNDTGSDVVVFVLKADNISSAEYGNDFYFTGDIEE